MYACCVKSLQGCPTLCGPMDCSPPGSSVHGDSPGKNTGVGCHALLQGIFLTQGSNPCLLCLMHCRQILYLLSHWRSPFVLQGGCCFCFPSGYTPGVELPDRMAALLSVFKERPYWFSWWLHQFTFPPTVYECSLFSAPSPAFVVCRLFEVSHSDWYEGILHCGSDLHFSNNQWYWASFIVPVSVCLLWKNVCLGPLPIFWLGCLFF